MSVTVYLYEMTSDRRRAVKTKDLIYTKTCTLKGDVDLSHPTLLLTGDVANYATINYMYIPDFQRYYFVDPPRVLPGEDGLVEVSGSCDVLSTAWEMGLGSLDAIIDKQETFYNLKLNDGSFQACVNDIVQTKEFTIGIGEGFGSPGYVLVVAG